LRFDFTHPEPVSPEQLAGIEAGVNANILENHELNIAFKPLQQAVSEGAMALFGEKYAETVRAISIGADSVFSYELCGGTHVNETGDIGVFLITGESSVGAGLRRIEAVTGQGAYKLIRRRFQILDKTASLLETNPELAVEKTQSVLDKLEHASKQIVSLRQELAAQEFEGHLEDIPVVTGIPVLAVELPGADMDTLRRMVDRFRQQIKSGVVLLASIQNERPILVAAVTEDLVDRGLHAGDLVKVAAQPLEGSGGGRPTLAQAGGKNASRIDEALKTVHPWVIKNLKG
jgi:alanyl-tRNA synthetase